jgi:Uma2 family endonuclease
VSHEPGVRRIGSAALTGDITLGYGGAMPPQAEEYARTRGLRRVEYDRLVDLGLFEGERIELLAGQLVVREPQGSSHAATIAQVAQVLAAAFGAGWHPRVQLPLALDDESEPEPDVAIVAGAPRDYLSAHPTTAALVVEVASGSLRLDRRLKGALYAGAGILDYWIVNLAEHALEVHRDPQLASDIPSSAAYRSVHILRPPATIVPLGAPAASIDVAELLL